MTNEEELRIRALELAIEITEPHFDENKTADILLTAIQFYGFLRKGKYDQTQAE